MCCVCVRVCVCVCVCVCLCVCVSVCVVVVARSDFMLRTLISEWATKLNQAPTSTTTMVDLTSYIAWNFNMTTPI